MITAGEARVQWVKIMTKRVENKLKEAIEDGSRYCIIPSLIPETCIDTLIANDYHVEQLTNGSTRIVW